LIVEDEAQVRYMEARTLEKCGYHVLNAANGIDAVSLYKQNQKEIDLVILDMVMPEMGGRECFYLLKDINTDIKIILVTGYTTDPLLMKEIKEKAAGIIEKPFTLHEFTYVIYRALNPSV
ncbi:MAG: response regulator, partial [Spirochaetales bacterium]|nr:response regulator [Spirochaetales bacterium]